MAGKNVPTLVKVISVLFYIGAVLLLIFGLLSLVGAGAMGSVASAIPILTILGSGLFVVLGIILIALAVLYFFIGRGLWKGQSWARIVAIILSIIGVVMAIWGMVQGSIASNVVGLIVNALIGGYLLFSSNVKAAF